MSTIRIVVSMFSAGLMVLGAGVVTCQPYPSKPIRIVTSAIGGGGDLISRLTADGISGSLGQPVIIDNRSGSVQGELVSKAPPDGYTLMMAGGTFFYSPLLEKTSYDPIKDFVPITLVAKEVVIIVVHPSLPVKSIKELIALAKARPGELNYSSGPVGGTAHLAGELFKAMAGVKIVHIAFKGASPAIFSLIGGEVQLTFAGVGAVTAHMKSGRLRAIAITGAEPSALAPGLPTVAASGLNGYEVVPTTGLLAPAKTPADIITRLHQEISRFTSSAAAKERFLSVGVDVAGTTPAEYAATIKTDTAKFGKLIKDLGIGY